jgi:hypothetical protein
MTTCRFNVGLKIDADKIDGARALSRMIRMLMKAKALE